MKIQKCVFNQLNNKKQLMTGVYKSNFKNIDN